MEWSYFDKFENATKKYLPDYGEGETMATQVCTAVTKLVYKWYNDGDVYDNTHGMTGWCNDLSSYANWLYNNCNEARETLERIYDCRTYDEYENILASLAYILLDMEYLDKLADKAKIGSIYDCDGKFVFEEYEEDEEEW